MLLLLAANDGQSDLGVYNTLEQLETGYLGQSAMLKFLRERRLDGLLAFDEHEKRSKWRVRLAQELCDELTEFLGRRNQKLAEAFADDAIRTHERHDEAGDRGTHTFARILKP